MNSSVELPDEVEDKPPLAVCELGNMKEKNLMQRDVHRSYFSTLLQNGKVTATLEESLDIGVNPNPIYIIEDRYKSSILTSGKQKQKLKKISASYYKVFAVKKKKRFIF